MTAPALSQREIAQRLLALRVVMDRIKAEDARLRKIAKEQMRSGDRVTGYLDESADPLGFVTLSKPVETPTIVDERAFTEWVKALAPTEIVTSVRESFTKVLLEEVKSHGGWISPDGELLAVEGVEVVKSSPRLSVLPTAEADQLIADALSAGRLQLMPGESES